MADLATQLAYLVVRQATDVANSTTPNADAETPACDTGNEYGGYMGARISSIFVILVGSFLGKRSPSTIFVSTWTRLTHVEQVHGSLLLLLVTVALESPSGHSSLPNTSALE